MLRKIRLTLAIVFFTLITLLFLDFTGTLHAWFGWMAKNEGGRWTGYHRRQKNP